MEELHSIVMEDFICHMHAHSAHSGICSQLDTRLWLECRAATARSLALSIHRISRVVEGRKGEHGDHHLLLDCSLQCEEGVRECEACGEVELCSALHYTAALHALAREPLHLDLVVTHAQVLSYTLDFSYLDLD